MASAPVDKTAMDYHAPRSSLADRLRAEQVIRKVERQAFGMTTRNYHRNQRRQQVAFAVMLVIGVLALLALAIV